MQAPVNEFYTEKEREFALYIMYRSMEMNRAESQAEILVSEFAALQAEYEQLITDCATATKSSIEQLLPEFETAIQGAVYKKIEETLPEKVKGYDTIVSV